ncbi:MAG: replication initiation protein [Candidatus Portiera sp.]|nr:replication initiation protein [Portiera sp.]
MGNFDKYGRGVQKSKKDLSSILLTETKSFPYDNVLALSRPELTDEEQQTINTFLQYTNHMENPVEITDKLNLNIRPGILYAIPYKTMTQLLPHQVRNKEEMAKVLVGLRDKPISYSIKDKKGNVTAYGQTSWLAGFKIDTKTWNVNYEFSASLIDLLISWRAKSNKGFTYKHIKNTYKLKKRGAIHLYNRLTAYRGPAEAVTISREDIYGILQQEDSALFSQINRRVLKPAIDEINRHTDILASYELVKRNGKIVDSIEFVTHRKSKAQLNLALGN